MKKLSVCVLFGGVSPEHAVSLRSAQSVLSHLDTEKYNIFPVGITQDGDWVLFGGSDYGMLPAGTWQDCPENRRAAIDRALHLACDGDVVVLAGKGHETYQDIMGVKHHFDEKEVVAELLAAMAQEK